MARWFVVNFGIEQFHVCFLSRIERNMLIPVGDATAGPYEPMYPTVCSILGANPIGYTVLPVPQASSAGFGGYDGGDGGMTGVGLATDPCVVTCQVTAMDP